MENLSLVDEQRAPDFELGPFYMWFHGWEFDQTEGWIDTSFRYETMNCLVFFRSMATEMRNVIAAHESFEDFTASRTREALFETTEPDLRISSVIGFQQLAECTIELTPSPVSEHHRFLEIITPAEVAVATTRLASLVAALEESRFG